MTSNEITSVFVSFSASNRVIHMSNCSLLLCFVYQTSYGMKRKVRDWWDLFWRKLWEGRSCTGKASGAPEILGRGTSHWPPSPQPCHLGMNENPWVQLTLSPTVGSALFQITEREGGGDPREVSDSPCPWEGWGGGWWEALEEDERWGWAGGLALHCEQGERLKGLQADELNGEEGALVRRENHTVPGGAASLWGGPCSSPPWLCVRITQGFLHQPVKSESLGVVSRHKCFFEFPRWFQCTAKVVNTCRRAVGLSAGLAAWESPEELCKTQISGLYP